MALTIPQGAVANEYGNLSGLLGGRKWSMNTVTLKRKISEGVSVLELEFFERKISETDICKSNSQGNNLLIQIPLNYRNGLTNSAPDYANADVRVGAKNGNFYYHELALNEDELNSKGLAYVSGRLEVFSQKTKTNVTGTFKARVCNLEKNI